MCNYFPRKKLVTVVSKVCLESRWDEGVGAIRVSYYVLLMTLAVYFITSTETN